MKCSGITQTGRKCSRNITRGIYCYQHIEQITNNKENISKTFSIKNEEVDTNKENIINELENNLNKIMYNWTETYSTNFSGGKMRKDRGTDIENFIINSINYIGQKLNINLIAKYGKFDKKDLKIKTSKKEICNKHQVDIHIYLNDIFIAVIECKAYLDSCYYTRACDDFKLFKQFGYNLKYYLFVLENCMAEDTKIFKDHYFENICNDVFIMLDGKRTFNKPIYNKKYKKQINKDKLLQFINCVYKLIN